MGLCLYGDTVKEVVSGPYHPAFGDLVKPMRKNPEI